MNCLVVGPEGTFVAVHLLAELAGDGGAGLQLRTLAPRGALCQLRAQALAWPQAQSIAALITVLKGDPFLAAGV